MTTTDDNLYAPEDDRGDLAYAVDDDQLSDLDQLAEDLRAEVAEPTRVRHPAPSMERYVMIFRSNIESAEAQSCEKRTKNSKKPVRDRNALFLAITNTGIERDGKPVENSKGRLVTFRDPEFITKLGAKTAADCVVKFMRANDGHLISTADAVAIAAGFGAGVEVVEDPTESA